MATRRPGKGFALLRRETCLRRLRDAHTSLPEDIATRLGDEAKHLFYNPED